jgi:hypothetical protein
LGIHAPLFSPQEAENLGHVIQGFSGSDLEILANEVLMSPVRELITCSKWRKIPVKIPGVEEADEVWGEKKEKKEEFFIQMASENSDGKFPEFSGNFFDLPRDRIFLRKVNYQDVIESACKIVPTITLEEYQKFIKYNNNNK